MKPIRRLQSLALAAALALTTVALPALAAGSTEAATILTQAVRVDNVTRNLNVQVYRRDTAGTFVPGSNLHYSSAINRTTENADFTFQVAKDGVQVTVDYLTDLNGDGVYELLDGESRSAADVLLSDGTLVPLSSAGSVPNLAAGEYRLSAATLKEGEKRAIAARTAGGSGQTMSITAGKILPSLFLVNLRSGQAVTSHYFALYEKVLMPSDVPYGIWYYDAVEDAMDRGYLNGSGPDRFTPDGQVTRAQLAQVLWNLSGGLGAADPGFGDVASDDWFYHAIAWCCQEGLMEGTDGLFHPDTNVTREEVAEVLFRCGSLAGLNMEQRESLDQFSDGATVAPQAQEGMSWAVAAGIFSGYDDGQLHPQDNLTRAQLAMLLNTFLELQEA